MFRSAAAADVQMIAAALIAVINSLPSEWRRARTVLPGGAGCDYCSEEYLDENVCAQTLRVVSDHYNEVYPDREVAATSASKRILEPNVTQQTKINDEKACIELMENCQRLCAQDPARYDFAFFGIGACGPPVSTPDAG